MTLSLKQWDSMISPYLHRLENAADKIAQYSIWMTQAVQQLPQVPQWETRARARMDYAEQQLTIALDAVRKAKTVYDAKERIVENA